MNNDTNPLKGLFRTVVPAVAGAAAINYAPQVVTKVIPQVAKTIVRHPKLATQIGKKLAINVGTDLATGWAGGTAVDLSTNIITGKRVGENLLLLIQEYLKIQLIGLIRDMLQDQEQLEET